MIRLFVGTDPQQKVAERALEASVRKNTSEPVDIVYMRQGDPGWDWGGRPWRWCTPFSMFRWYVPAACNYQGRAIYMDCDMLALGDLAELWRWPLPEGSAGAYAGRMAIKSDVILWQCDNAERLDREQARGRHSDARRLAAKNLTEQLPAEWDDRDCLRESTKILHFTKLTTQPWKPYPDLYKYDVAHPDGIACGLFWEYAGGQSAWA